MEILDGSSANSDMTLGVIRNAQNEVEGLFLRAGTNDGEFRLMDASESAAAARSYYDSLTEVPKSDYLTVGSGLAPDQVWAVRTRDGNYAKVLIESAFVQSDGIGLLFFEWTFQPNGEPRFE